jgi:Raf kinase inhibitor-like YbhB/YbcL family protein
MTTSTSTTSTTIAGATAGTVGPAGTAGVTLTAPVAAPSFTIQAPWPDGGAIDVRFTCDGEDRSPALSWSTPPPGTVELALVVTDDDAEDFVHWAVAAIPPTTLQVGEGAQITGAIEGVTDFGSAGWGGPCPPGAGETHRYRFSLYALGQQTELPDDFTGDELINVAASTALAFAEVTGNYTRGA